jgi:crotonobetainyl-CoA:carnitine CoA-transferase CaiB-like acyl-CoA transferase
MAEGQELTLEPTPDPLPLPSSPAAKGELATPPLDHEQPIPRPAPLAGIRVVALEQAVAAPLCSQHLVDLGADVVKIERPDGGDFARSYDSVVNGESAHFVWLNRGKRSIVLDLKLAEDRAVLDALLARTDVFIHNLGPGAVERLGYGWERLHEDWPQLISCAISGYGQTGPYRDRKAFDLLLQGESGVIAVTGTPEQPAKVGISVGDISAGVYALSAILAALFERVHTGEGRFIDVSMLECLVEWVMPFAYHQLYAGQPPDRPGLRHATIVPYGPYRTEDGWVNFAVQNEGQWERLCRGVLRRPDLLEDPRFGSVERRRQHRQILEPLIEEILANVTRAEVLVRLQAADVPFGALNELADVVDHPQLAARERWLAVASPHGPVRALAHPMNLQGVPQQRGAVPGLGEHTAAIRQELGLDGESRIENTELRRGT